MNRKTYAFLALIMAVVLSVRWGIYFSQAQELKDGQVINLETRLREDPDIKNGRAQFRVNTDTGHRVYITTGLNPQLKYGDKITVRGQLREKVYDDFTLFTLTFPDIQIVKNDQNFIARSAVAIREKSDRIYQKVLSPTSAGLLSGIVFGGDRNLPEEFSKDLRVSGVTHVIAASGMNVTFVASFLMGVLGIIMRRQIAVTISILGIFFYAFIAGFEPSIVRAAFMGSIVFSAKLLGRESFALMSLLLTAFLMLFYNPSLIFDVGFQLSVLSTGGIVLIKPIIDYGAERIFGPAGDLREFLGEDVGTTISAQAATLPILLGTFGSYGMLSVLVNALVLWTIPILMVIGGAGLIAGAVFEPLGVLVVLSAAPLLFFFERVVTFFGNFNWTISINHASVSVWLGYYLILGSIIVFMKQREA
jgi:ComEC/Rec2-related protein